MALSTLDRYGSLALAVRDNSLVRGLWTYSVSHRCSWHLMRIFLPSDLGTGRGDGIALLVLNSVSLIVHLLAISPVILPLASRSSARLNDQTSLHCRTAAVWDKVERIGGVCRHGLSPAFLKADFLRRCWKFMPFLTEPFLKILPFS